ncbi:MAG: helix-turn-helix transcriptional regulator [Anaerolineaceae bacterium]|jgi:transcriptional regulator with XRE-family HTH domain
MRTTSQTIQLRTKKLGLLILDARLTANKNLNEVAEAVGVSTRTLGEIESGKKAISLPELEALAFILGMPLEHFWGNKVKSVETAAKALPRTAQYIELRQRIIATVLRLARQKTEVSLHSLAEKTGITESQIKRYEGGDTPIPLPALEQIAVALELSVEDLMVERGKVGDWRLQQEIMQKFSELPPELQQFVCKPINRPYLELAMRLSALPVDRLRTVAEGLLEITY